MNDRTEIAIISAMPLEIAQYVRGWNVILGSRYRFYERDNIIAFVAGMGERFAREAAQAVLTFRAPKIVISAGLAGGLVPDMNVGTIVLPTKVLSARNSGEFRIEGGEGVLVSADEVVSIETKRRLRTEFGADAVDMEAAAIAEVAKKAGVRFAAIKSISDRADFVMPPVQKFIAANGQFQTGRFAVYAALRPRLWPAVAALQRNTALAVESLTKVLSSIHSVPDVDKILQVPARAS